MAGLLIGSLATTGNGTAHTGGDLEVPHLRQLLPYDLHEDPPLPAWVAQTEARGSIVIEDDDGFTEENGVREGSGTAADPYIIANWTVPVLERSMAIRIANTGSHVRIENIFVPAYTGFVPTLAKDGVAPNLEVTSASNVTIRNAWVTNGAVGLGIEASRSVVVDGLVLGRPSPTPIESLGIGLSIRDSADIHLRNVHIESATWVFDLVAVDDVSLQDSRLIGNEGVCRETGDETECRGLSLGFARDASNLSMDRNIIDNVNLMLSELSGALSFSGNSVMADPSVSVPSGGVYLGGRALQETRVCGNTFEHIRYETTSQTGFALTLWGADGAVVGGNTFRGNDRALTISGSPGVRIEENLFDDQREGALWISSSPAAAVSGNAFERNTLALTAYHDLDARHNWWGDPTGPSGDGPGDGDPVVIGDQDVPLDPWLTEAPELTLDCQSR